MDSITSNFLSNTGFLCILILSTIVVELELLLPIALPPLALALIFDVIFGVMLAIELLLTGEVEDDSLSTVETEEAIT